MASNKWVPGVYTDVDELIRLRHASKDLVLKTRKQSTAIMGGAVRTRYRGRGMEFAEVRPYQAGDDIRTIDWRVTARMQAPYTKLFQEEKERPVFVMVDQRAPMFFGSIDLFKSVYAARLAAAVAWIANNNNDRVGALVFGDREQRDIRAKRSKHAVLDLLNQVVALNQLLQSPIKPEGATSLQTMLTETSRVAHPGSLVILLSDFHDFDAACGEPLSRLGKRSDVLCMHLYDPLEVNLPPVSQLMVSDGTHRFDINAQSIGKRFTQIFKQKQEFLRQKCINSGVQYINVPTAINPSDFIYDLFNARSKKRTQTKRPDPTL